MTEHAQPSKRHDSAVESATAGDLDSRYHRGLQQGSDSKQPDSRRGRASTWFAALATLLFGIVLGVVITGSFALSNLNPFATTADDENDQVVQAISRQQNVELLKLGVQGIAQRSTNAKLFDLDVPGTSRALFLQYSYNVRLGLDGSQVRVTKNSEHSYKLEVPAFAVLGHSDVELKKAVEQNGAISLVTPEIDVAKMATEILNNDAEQQHLTDNKDALREQTQAFYGSIIRAIDPLAEVEYVFAE